MYFILYYPTECEPNRYGYRCQGVCDCVHGDCNAVSGCVCHEGYDGAHCETGAYSTFINQFILL